MGVHTSLVKRRGRNGVTRLIIEFYYSDKTGKRLRFVRHADLQTRDGAEREAAQYHERAVLTGNPETEKRDVVTLGEFYEGTFKCKVLPLYRKNTRIRYEALWRQRIATSFGAESLDAITEGSLRGFARSIELEKRKAKGPVAFVRTLLREAAQLGFIETAPRLPPGVVKDAKEAAGRAHPRRMRGAHRRGNRLAQDRARPRHLRRAPERGDPGPPGRRHRPRCGSHPHRADALRGRGGGA